MTSDPVTVSADMRLDEAIAWILALGESDEHLAARQEGGHVLQAVHGDVDFSEAERFVEFAREQALAAGIDQAFGGQPVAGGREGHDLRFDRSAGRGLQAGGNLVGLREGQRRATGAEAD